MLSALSFQLSAARSANNLPSGRKQVMFTESVTLVWRKYMYLARHFSDHLARYTIRESFRDGAHYRSRELFDLGPDPAAFIVYPGGNGYYIDEAVTDRLRDLGVSGGNETLDDLFWPFVDPRIRRALASFRNRGEAHRGKAALTPEERARIGQETHVFDKRRVHFLRVGRMDQGNVGRMPAGMLRWLPAKSRDELEQRFMQMERRLKPREFKAYVFVIFNLSSFFTQSFAKSHPRMLDTAAVDEGFEDALCRLNRDAGFWAGEDGHRADILHTYLKRYAVMFYDSDFGPNRFLERLARDFMNRHRFFRFPGGRSAVGYDEASLAFGEPAEALRAMNRRQLTRLYRSKARHIHPDTGGDHDSFIQLTEAYQGLMRKKRRI
jgi:hypothetical protein